MIAELFARIAHRINQDEDSLAATFAECDALTPEQARQALHGFYAMRGTEPDGWLTLRPGDVEWGIVRFCGERAGVVFEHRCIELIGEMEK